MDESKSSKPRIGIAGILGIVLLSLAFRVAGCGLLVELVRREMCGSYVFEEAYSPDNTYKAVVFQRDCGATTGFSTRVSILRSSKELPNKPGNVFAMDGPPRLDGDPSEVGSRGSDRNCCRRFAAKLSIHRFSAGLRPQLGAAATSWLKNLLHRTLTTSAISVSSLQTWYPWR